MLLFIRCTALAVAFLLSREQARFFDCNKVPGLSLFSGTATLLLVYACAEVLYRVVGSELSRDEKLLGAAKIMLVGGGVVAVAGFFTMMTHLCP